MPKLIPNVPIESIKEYHERLVIKRLMATLHSDCLIFHGFETLSWVHKPSKPSKYVLKEGEIDVVVFWPSKGLMVLEVKGGEIKFAEGKWTSTNKDGPHSMSDPFKQARKNMHNVVKRIRHVLDLKEHELNFPWAYGVVFPGIRYDGVVTDDKELPANAKKAILCDARNFKKIDEFISNALQSFSGENKIFGPSFSADKIKQALLPTFRLVRCLSTRIENERDQFLRLTDQQTMVLDTLERRVRAAIPGAAGSGKTLLAAEQAKRFSSQGLRTLVLCFNRGLGQWLAEMTADHQGEDIDVYPFHDFCKDVIVRAGGKFTVPAGKDERTEFYNVTAPKHLGEYAKAGNDLYDAVIVDEGQDFHEEWWVAINECLNPDARIFVFYDEHQDIFEADGIQSLGLLDLDQEQFPLKRNCRNTTHIAQFCHDFIGIDLQVPSDAPEGQPVVLEVEEDTEVRQALAIACLKKWLNEDALQPSQIAIISPYRVENTCLNGLDEVQGVPLVSDLEKWRSNEGILVATARSIKGLEADVVLLLDAIQPDSQPVFRAADFYVACSRARNHLHVIASEKLRTNVRQTA